MDCRIGCGACCIAPSISSPILGMPNGKPAGVRCIQLTEDHRCQLFGHSSRPAVCSRLRPTEDMCGQTREQAMSYLIHLEDITAPHGEINPGGINDNRAKQYNNRVTWDFLMMQ